MGARSWVRRAADVHPAPGGIFKASAIKAMASEKGPKRGPTGLGGAALPSDTILLYIYIYILYIIIIYYIYYNINILYIIYIYYILYIYIIYYILYIIY